ncbi:methyltransferase family protein [Krasilnikovia cinnamomea]|uniref:Methyltransferase family protein n=1 Tax=Krasilnikovia cinnamomea TaxID=349313 RepID=A0A4Q7ZPF4_9ACTN|nr:class I SAM-dependent methyltransferase [Krasilnikovia cinnamomea]RZU52604.1 methyltransferase family protein [Krasilnikovia cinnamomea]
MTVQRERRGVFGEVADTYERLRPGYPEQLVTDVLADAGEGPALEVGAGTGKATVAFAAHGIALTCVEPDPRMAALLRDRMAERPGVSVVASTFEDWRPDRGYGLLYSAQAWHWVDPERRLDLAHAALAPGGLLALFWNGFLLADTDLHAALAEVDRRYWPEGREDQQTSHRWRVDEQPVEVEDFAVEWEPLALHGDARFTDLRSRHYRWARTYPSDTYAQFLTTTSIYRMLPEAERDAALASVVEVIDAHGGTIEFVLDTALATARRV